MTQKKSNWEKARTKMDFMLDQYTWNIWGWVRDNKMSLDSGGACKRIREGFDAATEEVCTALNQAAEDNSRLRSNVKGLKARIKELESQVAEMEEAAAEEATA